MNLAYFSGAFVVLTTGLAVFIGGANADNCPCTKSTEATSVDAHHKADQKNKVEV